MAARARADSTVAALAASAGDGRRGGGGEEGEGVSAGVGEKRQQGDAVGAAEAVEEVGEGECKWMPGVIFGVI